MSGFEAPITNPFLSEGKILALSVSHLDLPVLLLVTEYCSGLMPLNMWKNIWPTKMTEKSESIVMEKIVLAFMISWKR